MLYDKQDRRTSCLSACGHAVGSSWRGIARGGVANSCIAGSGIDRSGTASIDGSAAQKKQQQPTSVVVEVLVDVASVVAPAVVAVAVLAAVLLSEAVVLKPVKVRYG